MIHPGRTHKLRAEMQHQRSFAGAGMFCMPALKAIAEQSVQRRLRDKAPPAHGNESCAVELSRLAAEFQSLEDEPFVFVMAVENDDRLKTRCDVPGDYVFQIIRKRASANADRARNVGTAPALRKRSRAVRDRGRNKSADALRHLGRDAHGNLDIHGQGQVRAMLLHRTDRQDQNLPPALRANSFARQLLKIAHPSPRFLSAALRALRMKGEYTLPA